MTLGQVFRAIVVSYVISEKLKSSTVRSAILEMHHPKWVCAHSVISCYVSIQMYPKLPPTHIVMHILGVGSQNKGRWRQLFWPERKANQDDHQTNAILKMCIKMHWWKHSYCHHRASFIQKMIHCYSYNVYSQILPYSLIVDVGPQHCYVTYSSDDHSWFSQ